MWTSKAKEGKYKHASLRVVTRVARAKGCRTRLLRRRTDYLHEGAAFVCSQRQALRDEAPDAPPGRPLGC